MPGRRQADQALAEKKKLVKHKNELINGFKNQMKLIDVLKRQVCMLCMYEPNAKSVHICWRSVFFSSFNHCYLSFAP